MRDVGRQPRGLEGIERKRGDAGERARITYDNCRRSVGRRVGEKRSMAGIDRWPGPEEIGQCRACQRVRPYVVEAHRAQAHAELQPILVDERMADRERPAIRTDRELRRQGDGQLQRPDHGRAALQGREQRPLCLLRAIERHRDDQQRADRDQQAPQSPVPSPLPLGLTLSVLSAAIEELTLQRVKTIQSRAAVAELPSC
jgi:hypothetical protein